TTHVIRQTRLARLLMVPYNTGWHLAHHVDIGVPFRHLPRFHEELVRSGWVVPELEYPSYLALWRRLASGAPRDRTRRGGRVEARQRPGRPPPEAAARDRPAEAHRGVIVPPLPAALREGGVVGAAVDLDVEPGAERDPHRVVHPLLGAEPPREDGDLAGTGLP